MATEPQHEVRLSDENKTTLLAFLTELAKSPTQEEAARLLTLFSGDGPYHLLQGSIAFLLFVLECKSLDIASEDPVRAKALEKLASALALDTPGLNPHIVSVFASPKEA